MRRRAVRVVLGVALLAVLLIADRRAARAEDRSSSRPNPQWTNGLPQTADCFPLAVWLQSPRNAGRYKAIGINLYVGLWKGPTAEQLAELKKHGMAVICEQNEYALKHLDDKTIAGWMHGDEPDNAQPLAKGKGYGPPIPPKQIVADYERIRAADPSRPVLLNLGQGVAWDAWHGRGVRTNHPEDYPEYARGGDIISFDIYPAVHSHPAVAGKLWYVARGVDRLQTWTKGRKIVWDCIECTRISNASVKPTPAQVKAEVWMSILLGSRGIIYFCHQFEPKFVEAGLLADEEMAKGVAEINRQVRELAPVINAPPATESVSVKSEPAEVSRELAAAMPAMPVAMTARKHGGAFYVFAVRMEGSPARATFQLAGLEGPARVEVLGEDRMLEATGGRFHDEFGPYAVHLYKIVR